MIGFFILLIVLIILIFILIQTLKKQKEQKALAEEKRKLQILADAEYEKLQKQIFHNLHISAWTDIPKYDDTVIVKSRQTLDKYDWQKYFKENKDKLPVIEQVFALKKERRKLLNNILSNEYYTSNPQFSRINPHLNELSMVLMDYRVRIQYITSAGNCLDENTIYISPTALTRLAEDPSILMTKTEYNQYLKQQAQAEKALAKEKAQEELDNKRRSYYNAVNQVIDVANAAKTRLINKNDKEEFDKLIARLYDGTVNSIQKIKTVDSQEWIIIKGLIASTFSEIQVITEKNDTILNYYKSPAFLQLKQTCDTLMSSQREFNEYINEKANSISQLFGTRVVRNETQTNDTYNYIRPYQKTITPFTAEVSSAVFASAENKPIEYIIKQFYPNKNLYPEQIKKLHLLVEELETLREAKQIIENYKMAYKKYLNNVPAFVLEQDEAGFYSRLGFAHIDESVLIVEYKFAYTSDGGMAQRSFTVPMTEDTIIELIHALEGKLTANAFAKEQRQMMTKKLREQIKIRDNYTCRLCGNSVHKEPNLLLEIDHIKPVALGGCTEESNLQTLCWKCNRSKGAKY